MQTRVGGWQIYCGQVPKHWVYEPKLSEMAQEALYFCRKRLKEYKAPMKVYTGYRSHKYNGKCYMRAGVICLDERRLKDIEKLYHTLAHEVAHMAYSAHGPRHAEITERAYQFFLRKLDNEVS